MPVIDVDKSLREKLGENGVTSLINLINSALNEQKNNIVEIVEKAFEQRLSEELAKFRVEIAQSFSEIREDMHSLRSEMIKWMFVFWIGQVAVFIGLFAAFLK